MCHLPPQLVVAGPAAITCGGTLGWPDGGGPAAAAPSGRKWSSTPVGLTRRRCASLCATCETGLGRWLLCRALECGAANGGVWSAEMCAACLDGCGHCAAAVCAASLDVGECAAAGVRRERAVSRARVPTEAVAAGPTPFDSG
jgi:hypothetical protein